jgi:hypothetical protein
MTHEPDGKRRRRHSANPNRRRWYAFHRSLRFRRRFGVIMHDGLTRFVAHVHYEAQMSPA